MDNLYLKLNSKLLTMNKQNHFWKMNQLVKMATLVFDKPKPKIRQKDLHCNSFQLLIELMVGSIYPEE